MSCIVASMTEPTQCVTVPSTIPPSPLPHFVPPTPTIPSHLPNHVPGLAFTGANIEYLFCLGLFLLAFGGILLISRRLRREKSVDATMPPPTRR